MGFAIVVMLIGVPIGLFMLLQPRKMWWLFESWKFRNPEANEPSDAAYLMTALGGLGVIAAVVFGGIMFWSADSDYKNLIAQQEADKQARADRQAAIDAYVAPPPENRGPLPVIGYTVRQTPRGEFYDLYYLAPRDTFPASGKYIDDRDLWDCLHSVGVRNTETNALQLNPGLAWAPERPPSEGAYDKCTADRVAEPGFSIARQFFKRPDPAAPIVTDSAIVDVKGEILAPAKPGNVVPRLDAEPKR
ncbi:DUF6199 family natural product biosynthesis protein [Mycolicibacterium arseniciresistens]|uniref:DUF6199 domain-containing protein n=1 Tax=Mycolicibacterium arseniciresistens TaxID=3062257 RepID=A0ABT8UGC7_9MYCO|nr:DUF6199 family natural product biosynthesis protein [Mycolicibacterium arseniciresistens]MDO3636833.1 hypothetical protein [Mycolicibacterium arseniciresistens]